MCKIPKLSSSVHRATDFKDFLAFEMKKICSQVESVDSTSSGENDVRRGKSREKQIGNFLRANLHKKLSSQHSVPNKKMEQVASTREKFQRRASNDD